MIVQRTVIDTILYWVQPRCDENLVCDHMVVVVVVMCRDSHHNLENVQSQLMQ